MKKLFHRAYHYLLHSFSAKTLHGTHSPFVYDFLEQVIYNPYPFYVFDIIESLRAQLLLNSTNIYVNDFGTGASKQKKISKIANNSLKPAKQAQLLFKTINYFKSTEIIELGTSLGITTLYLSKTSKKSLVHTFEGSEEIAEIAEQNFRKFKENNINIHIGNINETLPKYLSSIEKIDFVLFDANHTYNATLKYFNCCLNKSHEHTIFVFDDIHWSPEMTKAWNEIKSNSKVTMSIDFYHLGIIFFKAVHEKQHFKIKLK